MSRDELSLSGLGVLVVDDEGILRRRISSYLRKLGADTTEAESLTVARELLTEMEFDFIMLDIHLPDGVGLDLMRKREIPDSTGVLVMTAQGGVEGAVEAMQLGALDYLVKPFDPELLPLVMERARGTRQRERVTEHEREADEGAGFFFGESLNPLYQQMQKIIAADLRLVNHLPPILITGETGSGKSSIARWLHHHGSRSDQPMIEVNCSALPDTLAESELFGCEKGAYTDARATRQGLFEAAHGGTLFLDEIPSLSPAVQAKVLTAIEDRTIRRIGGTKGIDVDVRVIAATNCDLRESVESGEFREDLLHRLDLFRLNLPALRERGEDILNLAEQILERLCIRHRIPQRQIAEEGKRRLRAYGWPGNVRELAHELERELVFEDAAALDFSRLPLVGNGASALDPMDWLNPNYDFGKEEFVLEDAINRLVQLALKKTNGNTSAAARMLGVTRDFIRYRLHGDRKEKV
ncbi:sigma-54 dependent transcriptional regulator [Pontiella sp. NLcol2]|uniref:Sigma-54 dependent transcriptional regulator n=2 Tax=Pontiella agarivorans TaxID=3038953 RepID=A0ABU5MVC6_9BACT|nr:sigma-54 dependent transcriptional regulator [Pontiella agarivorans]